MSQDVGRHLASLRVMAGRSQREQAKAMGTAQAQVSYLERGTHEGVQLQSIVRYADVLGYDVEVVFTPRA